MTTQFSTGAQVSKEVKRRLTVAFPGTKFSVRYSSYAGGNSLRITYDGGPVARLVEEICNPFQEGRFDGMTDTYNYDPTIVVGEGGEMQELGGVKYVFVDRDFTEADREVIGRALCRYQGKEYQGYDTQLFDTWQPDGGAHQVARRILRYAHFPHSQVAVLGLVQYKAARGSFEDCFAVRYRDNKTGLQAVALIDRLCHI